MVDCAFANPAHDPWRITSASRKATTWHSRIILRRTASFGKVVESIVSARAEAVAAIGECTEEICLGVFTRISMLKKDDVKSR
jgi:hypothetical protein